MMLIAPAVFGNTGKIIKTKAAPAPREIMIRGLLDEPISGSNGRTPKAIKEDVPWDAILPKKTVVPKKD